MITKTNPFTGQRASGGRGALGHCLPWLLAALMTVAAATFLWLWVDARVARQDLESLHAHLSESATNLVNVQAENQKSQEQIAALQSQLADLKAEKEKTAQQAQNLEKEMRADLESKDVTISNLKGKLTVNIVDRVLFDSGEAVLKPDGQAVLQKVADLLAKHPELKIHVIGHTDNVPIRMGPHSRFVSNWELSTARALAAVHFLTEQAGVDARRLGAVGYGEFRPIADNATAEGRAKNRRIAITVLPDELAGADTAPTAQPLPNAPVVSVTNVPPVAEAIPSATSPEPSQP